MRSIAEYIIQVKSEMRREITRALKVGDYVRYAEVKKAYTTAESVLRSISRNLRREGI